MNSHLVTSLFLWCVWTVSFAANHLETPPPEEVILTLSGNIKISNTTGSPEKNAKALFSLKMLQALPQHTIVTQNPWVDRPHTYKGPKISTLMKVVDAKATYLKIVALNDFQVKVEWHMIKDLEPILAWEDDGKVMNRRDKGPLWLILPVDEASLKHSKYFDTMVWQIKEISFES